MNRSFLFVFAMFFLLGGCSSSPGLPSSDGGGNNSDCPTLTGVIESCPEYIACLDQLSTANASDCETCESWVQPAVKDIYLSYKDCIDNECPGGGSECVCEAVVAGGACNLKVIACHPLPASHFNCEAEETGAEETGEEEQEETRETDGETRWGWVMPGEETGEEGSDEETGGETSAPAGTVSMGGDCTQDSDCKIGFCQTFTTHEGSNQSLCTSTCYGSCNFDLLCLTMSNEKNYCVPKSFSPCGKQTCAMGEACSSRAIPAVAFKNNTSHSR